MMIHPYFALYEHVQYKLMHFFETICYYIRYKKHEA